MNNKRAYRIDELAEAWDVSRRTVERLIKSGELPSFKIRDTRRIDAAIAEEFQKKSASGDVKRA